MSTAALEAAATWATNAGLVVAALRFVFSMLPQMLGVLRELTAAVRSHGPLLESIARKVGAELPPPAPPRPPAAADPSLLSPFGL